MSKKPSIVQRRPQPPTVEDIVQDILSSSTNDVVFKAFNYDSTSDDVPDPMTESYASVDDVSTLSRSTSNQLNSTDISEDNQNVESTYKQAVKLIKLVRNLEHVPDEMENKFTQLQKLGSELEESITDLKQQSQTALDKSISDGST